MRKASYAFLAMTLLIAACSTAGSGNSGPRRNRDVITAEELAELAADYSVYEAVQRLRANWLTGRGGSQPRVHVDGVALGGLDILRNYRIQTVREVRFVQPSDATMRFGTGYGGGAIEIVTR
ncbi:MAG: hypothetical protein PVJ76_02485 [Gemmatimonadota bacterium]